MEDCSPGHDAMPIHVAMVSVTVSLQRFGKSPAEDKWDSLFFWVQT
jgi:hypothetical protein